MDAKICDRCGKVNGVSDRIREALDIPDAKKIIEENIL